MIPGREGAKVGYWELGYFLLRGQTMDLPYA